MDVATAIATVSASAGGWMGVRWARRRRRRQRLAERIRMGEVDLPLDTAHLSPALARLTEQTRMVRLILATPLYRFRERVVQELPWRRRERCDEYDLALVDARRALWEWLRSFQGLDAEDRATLGALGLSPRDLGRILFAPGVFERTDDVFEEVVYPVAPDLDRVSSMLAQALCQLRQFEVALLSWRPDPYR